MSAPLRATLFAFQKRERGILLGATGCYAIISAALLALLLIPFFAVMGLDIRSVLAGAAASQPAPPDPMKALLIVPLALVFAFAFCVLMAAYEAACLRWMVRGEKPGLFGLTLDADTWRVYGIYWIWLLAAFVAWIGFLILSGLLGMLFPQNQIALWIGLGLYGCAMLLSAASLAPAAAVSVAERGLTFGDAFHATENHFPSLLGSFIVLVGGQYLITNGVTAAWVVWALEGDVLSRFAGATDWASLTVAYNQTFTAAMSAPGAIPVYWAVTAFTYVVSFAVGVLLYGVNARVARLALQEGTIRAGRAS